MSAWVVLENTEYGNKIVGIYRTEERAKEEHSKFPVWRYIEEWKVE